VISPTGLVFGSVLSKSAPQFHFSHEASCTVQVLQVSGSAPLSLWIGFLTTSKASSFTSKICVCPDSVPTGLRSLVRSVA
jgi:hypothetical protein